MKTPGKLGLASGWAMLLCIAAPTHAAFTLIDNFDSYDNSVNQNLGAHANSITSVWAGMWDGTNNAQILDDAVPGDNSLAAWGAGGAWRGAEADLTNSFASDFSLADGSTATYFFQVMNEGSASADCMIGLSENVGTVDEVNSWQDFAVMPYVAGGAGSTNLNVYGANGSGGLITAMTDGEWYNVWLVVDNANKVFDMYTSTGSNAGVLGLSGIEFGRITAPVHLEAFAISNAQDSRVHIDNLYMTSGADTSYPIPEPASLALIGLGGLSILIRRR